MIPRYNAPIAREVFDQDNKFAVWTQISRAYAREHYYHTDIGHAPQLDTEFDQLQSPTAASVGMRESYAGHDVVAFLSLLEQQLSGEAKRHLHYGLTSSDLVDNAHMLTLTNHAESMAALTYELSEDMLVWETLPTIRPGRTHGQIAHITSWTHQMKVYWTSLRQISEELRGFSNYRVWKSAGPTGVNHDGRDIRVASLFAATVVPSTQVIPRDHQVRWAALYVRLACVLENVAVLVRAGARSEVEEVAEGARRVGSSSMPTKRNPIDSEKVCGLASVARGYFSAIAEGSVLWEDRDISNSSLERIVIPDMAAVVEHMVMTMTKVISNLEVNTQLMGDHAVTWHAMTHVEQMVAQDMFNLGPTEASKFVRDYHADLPTEPMNTPGQEQEWREAVQLAWQTAWHELNFR